MSHYHILRKQSGSGLTSFGLFRYCLQFLLRDYFKKGWTNFYRLELTLEWPTTWQ